MMGELQVCIKQDPWWYSWAACAVIGLLVLNLFRSWYRGYR